MSDHDHLPDEDAAALAGSLEPVALDPTRRARLKARILAAARAERREQSERPPAPRTARITIRASARTWRQVWPGVEACTLHENGDARAYLLRMQPGSSLPAHEHDLDEESIILEGDALLGDDAVGPGDYHFAPAGTSHPVIRTRGGCIVFIRGQRRPRPTVTPSLLLQVAKRLARRFNPGRFSSR